MKTQTYFSVQGLREGEWYEVHCATTRKEANEEVEYLRNPGSKFRVVPITVKGN